jgi:hypothetical protein
VGVAVGVKVGVSVGLGVGVMVGASAVWVAKMLAAISVASAFRFSSAEIQDIRVTAINKQTKAALAVRFIQRPPSIATDMPSQRITNSQHLVLMPTPTAKASPIKNRSFKRFLLWTL